MKKISKEERKGAIILAIVVLVILCATFFIRECSTSRQSDAPTVTVIYKEPVDTVKKPKKNKSGKTKKKSSAKGTSKKSKSQKREKITRDFLSDTIPTR